ncbi:molybdopterin-dependent oxidoreductase [Nocardia aurea]|uniref:molybdopterin-dependent oxidoreductase n=1 Tax=Nocardia aurea TaxID=2144174 RepID=UPI0033B9D642
MKRPAESAPSISAAVVAGILAAATVLGVGQVIAAVIDPEAAPFFALGGWVVDHTPHTLKDSAIRRFGSNDKLALFLSMSGVMLVGAALIGILERRRPLGSGLLVGFAALVVVAALQRPTATLWFAAPTALGAVTGVAALRLLRRRAPSRSVVRSTPPERAGAHRRAAPGTGQAGSGPTRRGFLALTAGVGAFALGTAAAGQWIGGRLRDVVADRARFPLPRTAPVAAASELPVRGLTEFVTPNDRFYRVDTALRVPTLRSTDWRLRIHGMVDRELDLDFDDLRARTAVARMITLTCVSNEVGGDLAGTAIWTGYPLADLLAEAGVRPGADLLLSRSVDGFTAGTTVSAVTDGRDALLAVGMNGSPLPIEHGYPARLVVPGLYGYVSATKWVVDLELTRFDRAGAYWTDRGWAALAPIKTASRIDVPAAFATVPAGRVVVAGVAWAQRLGIDRVEVQIDENPWQQAELGTEYSVDTWRQWSWWWDAAPGTHTLRVRAVDRAGAVQTDARARPFPDGSTGWHNRVVTVR